MSLDPLQRVEPAERGQPDVEDGDAGLPRQGQPHRLRAVRRLGDHPHVALAVEERAQPRAHHGMIVRQQNRDHRSQLQTRAVNVLASLQGRGVAVTRARWPFLEGLVVTHEPISPWMAYLARAYVGLLLAPDDSEP